MMKIHPQPAKVRPIEAVRRVTEPPSQTFEDAHYWAAQVAAVASAQDVGCFMRVYDYYAPRLLRYLLGLNVSPAQAEELVQESMLRLWRRAGQFDPARANVSTWLFRIARNLYLDSVRGEPHWIDVQDGLEWLDRYEAESEGTSTETFADHARLARAIDRLPAVQARLVRMSYLESKSHSEIAQELGMPLGSVKSNLRRAFAKLQAGLRSPS
jgi:RNA polymerase sigma-70 factor (ECF subfamily)